MSIILYLVGSRMSDDSLTRQGYRQVVRISGKSWSEFRNPHALIRVNPRLVLMAI
jgi:hypothetical protein